MSQFTPFNGYSKIHSNQLNLSLELSTINLCGDQKAKFDGIMVLKSNGPKVNVSQKFKFSYNDPCKKRLKYTIPAADDEFYKIIYVTLYNFYFSNWQYNRVILEWNPFGSWRGWCCIFWEPPGWVNFIKHLKIKYGVTKCHFILLAIAMILKSTKLTYALAMML